MLMIALQHTTQTDASNPDILSPRPTDPSFDREQKSDVYSRGTLTSPVSKVRPSLLDRIAEYASPDSSLTDMSISLFEDDSASESQATTPSTSPTRPILPSLLARMAPAPYLRSRIDLPLAEHRPRKRNASFSTEDAPAPRRRSPPKGKVDPMSSGLFSSAVAALAARTTNIPSSAAHGKPSNILISCTTTMGPGKPLPRVLHRSRYMPESENNPLPPRRRSQQHHQTATGVRADRR
jgi:hypothetical protein